MNIEYTDYEVLSSGKEKTKFYIQKKYDIQKGFLFWITRKFWSLEASGKRWQIISFYTVFFLVMMPIGISTDIAVLILLGAINFVWAVIKAIWKLLQQISKAFFTKLLYPAFRNILTIAIIIILIIIVIYRFDFIRTIILKLFDSLL